MSSNGQELHELLGLEPSVVDNLSFSQFLSTLKDRPEVADSAAATLVRAIESKGEVEIETSPPQLRPYLKMLKKMGVPTYNAFKDVRGSQRVVARILNHLRAAAANGYQLRLAMLLKGGPGSGKSFLANSFKDALEGEIVYAVDGCPVHENPINLLNFLPDATINEIEKRLGMTEADRDREFKEAVKAAKGCEGVKPKRKPTLRDLLAISGQPCQHCWESVMKEGEKHPNLGEVRVKAVRLSSRNFGISTWSKNCTLAQSLELGSRGVVDMPELFGSAAAGKDANALSSAEELDILLEATNDRQIPAGCGDSGACGDASSRKGFLPLDAVMIGQTNDGSYARFMSEQADPDKFMRRIAVFNVPYITSVSEEEEAYRAAIEGMRDQPNFDPMTLKITALLAVISRMKKDHTEVDIVRRARMYDGEQLAIEKRNINSTGGSNAAQANSANPFGNYGTRTTSTPARKVTAYWSVGEFWSEAGEDEGMAGINMPDMLNIISEAVSIVMRDVGPDKVPSISALEMLRFLRVKVEQMKKKPGLTPSQKTVLDNCSEYLRPPKDFADKPGLIEAEYRRVLQRQFLEVIAPDFERRAKELFERYRAHAKAFAGGQKDAVEMVEQAGKLGERRVKVNFDGILDDLENQMGLVGETERHDFRRSVEGHILQVSMKARLLAEDAEEGDEESADIAASQVEVTWRTLPKLAEGIAKKLNDESAKKLERVLKSEIELSEEDKAIKRDALKRFSDLGYSEHSANVALTYFNDYQLWKQS